MDQQHASRKRKRHTPSQVVEKLRDADMLLAQGHSVADIAAKLGVSEVTFNRWRNQYGGMKAEEMKRLKELEAENARLKRAVADLTLDNQILKEVAKGEF
jgi:transposase-like protein